MKKNSKKIALVHDVFIEQGGAEKVLLSLIRLYPQADVFIPLISPESRKVLKATGVKNIFSSFFNFIPFIHSASLLLKPFFYWYWETLDLSGYDVVISSSHSFSSKAVITSPQTLHISYVHTPPRYLYTEFNETQILRKPFVKSLLTPLLSWLRQQDFLAAQRPDILVANSLEVQKRIAKYYRRTAVVIYPPIADPLRSQVQSLTKSRSRSLKQQQNRKEYYLCFSRLAKQKRIDLAILACNQLGKKLVIVGEGGEKSYLQSLAGENVTFLGRVPDGDLPEIFQKAKAMIYPSIQEDFGMAPVEALSYGVPVISFHSGGVKEFVKQGKNGLFFYEPTVESVKDAIVRFEKDWRKKTFSSRDCIRSSRVFSEKVFQKKIQNLVKKSFAGLSESIVKRKRASVTGFHKRG